MEFEFGSMWFGWFEVALVDKNRKNLLWVCERLDASCCYEWFCLLVSELTIRQIHSYQHPTGSHTQKTINHRYAQKPFFRSTQTLDWFEMFEMFERFEGFLMECLLKNHFQVQVEKMFFLFIVLVVVHSPKGCWCFVRLRMEARLHSQAHKTPT